MRLVGIAALFSGVALLAHILTNISLRVGLGVTVLIALGGLYLAFKRSDPEEKKNILGDDAYFEIVRRIILYVNDILWMEHIETMDYLRSSVNLRAYGQRDPLVEYKKEGFRMFKEMEISFQDQVLNLITTIDTSAAMKTTGVEASPQAGIGSSGRGRSSDSAESRRAVSIEARPEVRPRGANTNGMIKVYKAIRKELKKYDPELIKKDEIIILTKTDTIDDPKKITKAIKEFKKINSNVFTITLYDDKSIKNFSDELIKILKK
ncbi:MAG: hypothetical protein US50_C0050G0003 [Candidatus Nomurabacteria bacterium GW2011_GWB1_37_5]|uniref:SecA Wing/Scaffold domain-containing protein n=1 Tax=Candidatus Nomurabacteria bacterium GW2011_GWB1_37_5 TaxID=1618742 RepID=A0A0G0H780_9BACT|nr:MAG: hypothetical protein US50_C0050G0003 [Candidatus Nomurabacteria bacterium GW2011_GWB1_37_5]